MKVKSRTKSAVVGPMVLGIILGLDTRGLPVLRVPHAHCTLTLCLHYYSLCTSSDASLACLNPRKALEEGLRYM